MFFLWVGETNESLFLSFPLLGDDFVPEVSGVRVFETKILYQRTFRSFHCEEEKDLFIYACSLYEKHG